MKKNEGFVFTIVLTILAAMFLSFVLYYQRLTHHKAELALEAHAVIIADALWRYEKNTPIGYLTLAAKSNHYNRVSVIDDSGTEFTAMEFPHEKTAKDILSRVGLLPVYHLEKDIFYNQTSIGKISVDWQNRAVFIYFYIFLCLVLILTAIWFFLKLMVAKTTLEDRVVERTADLRKSENRLRRSEERLEMALAGANDGIWDWNLENGSVHFDDRYYAMVGYEPHEFQNSSKEWEKRIHADDVVRIKSAVDDYLSDKVDTYHQEFRFLNKKGDYQWILTKGKIAARDENKKPTRFSGTHSDINDRKLLEKARDDAYAIVNSSPLVAFTWRNEPGWPVEVVTQNIETVFGYHPDELLSNTIRYDQIVFPDDLERFGQEVRRYSGEKNCENLIHKPYRIVTKSGEIRWVEDRTYIKRNDAGNITHYHGILLDITKRIEAEKAQLKTHRILKLVLNSIPVRVFWKDTNCIYLGANKAFAQDAGMPSPDDLIGKTDHDFPFAEQAELFHQDDIDVMNSGKSKLFYEEPQSKPDGQTRWLMTSKVPMRDEQQNIIGILGTYQDITDRKQTEEEIRNLRNYLENIIDSMPSVLIGVDREGRITQWNQKAQQITGVSLESAKGQPLEKAFPILSNELERVKQAIDMRQVCSDPRQARREEDQTRYEDVTIYPLVANGVEGAVIRVDDVTEQVRLEEMMVQSEKMLSVGGLAAGMAHEINNPLAGMIQTANVMKSRLCNLDMPANRKAAEAIGVSMDHISAFMEKRSIIRMVQAINESGQRVAEIVDNMLSFARKTDAVISSHHPVQLLDQIIELASTDYDLKKQYDFKTIKIVKEYQKNLPMVPCERAKIQQVLLNILSNGAQAMQMEDAAKDVHPCFVLRLLVEKEKRMLKIEIEDNGPGMDEMTQSRVFEPFFTTKPVGVGTGLGLSVSYFIITQNHGGTMDVVSTLGKGSTFIIRLPLKKNGKK
jgi:PAS domain S-box-containing protein